MVDKDIDLFIRELAEKHKMMISEVAEEFLIKAMDLFGEQDPKEYQRILTKIKSMGDITQMKDEA